MEKLKNFIYDKNDIVIALIIVVLAGFIITGRIEAIMTFPDKMAAEAAAQNAEENAPGGSVPDDNDSGDVNGTGGQGTEGTEAEGTDTAAGDTGTATGPLYPATESGSVYPADPGTETTVTPPATPGETTTVKIVIPSGTTGDGIGQILVTNGLISKKTDFTNAVTAVGADTKLKAGTFRIPSGSTPAEIVSIITK